MQAQDGIAFCGSSSLSVYAIQRQAVIMLLPFLVSGLSSQFLVEL